MKKFLSILLGIFLLPNFAYGDLELELTQGTYSAVPIAALPFAASGEAADKANKLYSVIKNDLTNSGRFRLSETALTTIDYDYLRSQKIDNALSGSAEPAGNGRYKITLQLHDTFGKSVLLDNQYTASPSQLRDLAHHISDQIYEKLTGIRGIFSTHIAYILVQRLNGKPVRYSLEVADADGYNPRTIMASKQPIMSPAWSPDGKRIAYVSFENNRATIFSQDVATGARRVITKFPGINGAPAWSPDGGKMALVLTQTGDPKIYLLDLATKRLSQLTSGWSLDTEPNFSPDGRSIIFTSNRSGGPQIYKFDLISDNIERISYQGNYNARASFAPDGKTIVMLHQDNGMFNIAAQNLESGRLQVLTQTGFDESPSIAPNGSMIVYATTYNGKGVLAEVSIDGRVKLLLPSRDGDVQEPAWAPF